MTGLLHATYTPGQMTYDLRRLRLTGLIRRIEHTNRYVLTPDGIKIADLLHQAPQPAPAPAPGRRPAPGPGRTPCRPAHHRPAHRHLHHPRPDQPGRVKT